VNDVSVRNANKHLLTTPFLHSPFPVSYTAPGPISPTRISPHHAFRNPRGPRGSPHPENSIPGLRHPALWKVLRVGSYRMSARSSGTKSNCRRVRARLLVMSMSSHGYQILRRKPNVKATSRREACQYYPRVAQLIYDQTSSPRIDKGLESLGGGKMGFF
jgi:hypothetical protein